MVVLAENKVFEDEAGRNRNYSEVSWRQVEPLDRVGELTREVALSILRRTWSICAGGDKRPHEKVDEILALFSALEVI